MKNGWLVTVATLLLCMSGAAPAQLVDSDGDRVAEGLDRCPATQNGVAVDALGCSAAQNRVTPPGTLAARRPIEVRIPVLRDPSLPRGRSAPVIVDAAELPAGMGPTSTEPSTLLKTVYFKPSSSVLTPEAQDTLTRVAEALLVKLPQRPRLRIHLVGYAGHTDPNTDPGPSENFAAARVNKVRTFLILRGLPRERFTTEGRIARRSEPAKSKFRVEVRLVGLDDAAPAPAPSLPPALMQPSPAPAAPAAAPSAPSTPKIVEQQRIGWVLFQGGSAALDARATQIMQAILPQLRQLLAADRTRIVEVRGHADRSSENSLAVKLANDRARVLRDYLVTQGLDPRRLQAVGRGNQDAVSAESLLNRRADVWIVTR